MLSGFVLVLGVQASRTFGSWGCCPFFSLFWVAAQELELKYHHTGI